MLLEFSVANYRSIKEELTLSMIAADKLRSQDNRLDKENRIFISSDLSLLKSAVIYGANASGKSNLIRAFQFVQSFVRTSSTGNQVDDLIDVEHFRLGGRTSKDPSEFEVVFFINNIQFRYGFSANTNQITEEYLFYIPKVKEVRLFERVGDEYKIGKAFDEGQGLHSKTRPNALFLSVVAQFNGRLSSEIIRWFATCSIIVPLSYTNPLFEDSLRLNEVVKFIKRLDMGIEDIQVSYEDSPMEVRDRVIISRRSKISSTRRTFGEDGTPTGFEVFDFRKSESGGTKKLFSYADRVLQSLEHGHLLVIDELEVSLHPLLTRSILRLFNSSKSNPKGAQLVFTTHDTNLLDRNELRRDQIWFTEKDRIGATHLFSLAEYRVRNDASFESDYIKGKYGAIPFLGSLESLYRSDEEDSVDE